MVDNGPLINVKLALEVDTELGEQARVGDITALNKCFKALDALLVGDVLLILALYLALRLDK